MVFKGLYLHQEKIINLNKSWEATSFWPYLANYWPKGVFVGLVSLRALKMSQNAH